MNRIIIILLFLLAVKSSHAQARFIQQIDQSTHFGANLQGLSIQEEITVVKRQLQQKYMRYERNLIDYVAGGVDNGLKRIADSGLRAIINLNWENGGTGSGGNKSFPSNMTTYRSRLSAFISDNKQYMDAAVVIIENEPFNPNYFGYATGAATVADYIREFSNAVDVCRSFNVMVADGSTQFSGYAGIDAAYPNIPAGNETNADVRNGKFMYADDTIRANYLNYHFDANAPYATINDSTMTPNLIRDNMALAYKITHHQGMSNEWHQEDMGATSSQWNKLCTSIVTETRKAHVRYGIVFSGDGTHPALQFVNLNNLTLTPLGQAYRDAVLSGQ